MNVLFPGDTIIATILRLMMMESSFASNVKRRTTLWSAAVLSLIQLLPMPEWEENRIYEKGIKARPITLGFTLLIQEKFTSCLWTMCQLALKHCCALTPQRIINKKV